MSNGKKRRKRIAAERRRAAERVFRVTMNLHGGLYVGMRLSIGGDDATVVAIGTGTVDLLWENNIYIGRGYYTMAVERDARPPRVFKTPERVRPLLPEGVLPSDEISDTPAPSDTP